MLARWLGMIWTKAAATCVLLILAGCSLVAAHVLDDQLATLGVPQEAEYDLTPPYWLLVGWGLVLLAVFAVSVAWTAPDADDGYRPRVFFRLAGGGTFLYILLMALGDWHVMSNGCAPGVSPDYSGYYEGSLSCYPSNWVHWDQLQLPLHAGVCVLLLIAFHFAVLTWRQLSACTVEDRSLEVSMSVHLRQSRQSSPSCWRSVCRWRSAG